MADVKHLLAQLAEHYEQMQAHIDSRHEEGSGNRDPEGPAPAVGPVEQGDRAEADQGGSDG